MVRARNDALECGIATKDVHADMARSDASDVMCVVCTLNQNALRALPINKTAPLTEILFDTSHFFHQRLD